MATCGGIENQPAKLKLFECDGNGHAAKTIKQFEVSFSKVVRIRQHHTSKQSIVLTLDDNRQFSFYPELDTEFEKWFKYCLVLQKIPNYSIPKLPKIKSMKLGRCSDTDTRRLHASTYINCVCYCES